MRAAYHAVSTLDAQAQLEALAREPDKTHPGAAASLREGLAETLTVLRLGVPPTLARMLRSTDESFKALAALPAGPGAIRLRVGRGRPRSQEQDRGAGSPAAQLCPVEGPNVAPQWRRPRPCSPVRMVAAWAPSCR